MGSSRLSIRHIIDYLDVYPIPDIEERERFVKMIFAMDDEFVLWVADKSTSKAPPSKDSTITKSTLG